MDLCLVAGEFWHAGGSEFGFFGKKHAHVVEDIGGGCDELGALLNEAVGAYRVRVVDASGNRVDRATLLAGLVGADECSAGGACLYHKHTEGASTDDAVSHGEGLAVGFDTHGKLGDDCA